MTLGKGECLERSFDVKIR